MCYDGGEAPSSMAIEALEIRMAKLEGGYEQINERLGAIEHRLTALEQRFVSEMTSLRSEMTSQRSETSSLRSEIASRSDLASLRSEMGASISELRRQMNGQFYWLLTFVLGSILVPILRDLAR